MKHSIKFSLPEDKEELDHVLKAKDYYCALWEFGQEYLFKIKQEKDTVTVDEVINKWNAVMDKYGVNL